MLGRRHKGLTSFPARGPCRESSQRGKKLARVEISYFYIVTEALRSPRGAAPTRQPGEPALGCDSAARQPRLPGPDRGALGSAERTGRRKARSYPGLLISPPAARDGHQASRGAHRAGLDPDALGGLVGAATALGVDGVTVYAAGRSQHSTPRSRPSARPGPCTPASRTTGATDGRPPRSPRSRHASSCVRPQIRLLGHDRSSFG